MVESDSSSTTENLEITSSYCPICLEILSSLDLTYTLLCTQYCGFNMCIHCILKMRSVSQEDTFMEASDGNLFRLAMKCPNCRSMYHGPLIGDVTYLRKYDHNTLDNSTSAVTLSAQWRYQKYKKREIIEEVFKEDTHDKSDNDVVQKGIDTALLSGLENAMTSQEQYYITSLMTSGDYNHVAQAAMALHQMEQVNRTRRVQMLPVQQQQHDHTSQQSSLIIPHRTTTTPSTQSLSNTTTGYSNYNRVGTLSNFTKAKQQELLNQQQKDEEWKRLHPLPVRLPRAFTLDVDLDPYDKRRTCISFLDDEYTLYSCYHHPRPPPTSSSSTATYNTNDSNNHLLSLIQDAFCRLTIQSGSVVVRQPMEHVQGVASLTSLLVESCHETRLVQQVEPSSTTQNAEPWWWSQPWKFIVEGTIRTFQMQKIPTEEMQKIPAHDIQTAAAMDSESTTVSSCSTQVQTLDTHSEVLGKGLNVSAPGSETQYNMIPWRRIVISSIQGPISRLGIRPGDVITHINGEAFHGNSEGLRYFLSKQRGNPVHIVVNAERGVAEALRLRSQCAKQRKGSSSDAT